MLKFAPGSAIPVSFNLNDSAGSPIQATALSWRLLDQDDVTLLDWQSLALPAAGQPATLSVPPEATALTYPQTRAVLRVELRITHPLGVMLMERFAMVAALSALAPGHNSFQTYAAARALGSSLPSGSRWEIDGEATKEEHEAALAEAFMAIMRLPLFFKTTAGDLKALRSLEPSTMLAMVPAAMLRALRLAQVLEANAAVDADPLLLARRRGLISMTVGESSQFFGTKPLDMAVLNPDVMRVLQEYVRRPNITLGRA